MRTLQADLATFTSDPEDVDSASSLRTGHYSSTRRRSAEAGEETQRTHAGGRADPPHAGSNLILVVCGYFSVITATTVLLCVAVNVVSATQSFHAGYDVRGTPRLPCSIPVQLSLSWIRLVRVWLCC